MHKFRNLKDKIIHSKRVSQKIDEQQLLQMIQANTMSRLNTSVALRLKKQVHDLTEHNYKIYQQERYKRVGDYGCQGDDYNYENSWNNKGSINTDLNEFDRNQTFLIDPNFIQTAKKSTNLAQSVIENSNFTKIIDLMKEVNEMQQQSRLQGRESVKIKEEIRRKLAEVKFLISTIEDQSQKSIIDFYNEDCNSSGSPHSFHSQNSDETYHPYSERGGYQFSAEKRREDTDSTDQGNIEIKYRRISPQQYGESICSNGDDEFSSPQSCSGFQERKVQKSIIHLFSYEKEHSLGSPLSRISERDSQYCTPSSKQSNLAESLQYKKIFYLLQTSEKKQQSTKRILVSEFTSRDCEVSGKENIGKDKGKERCQEQFEATICLLETKYKRKIKVKATNLMDSLRMALKDKSIKLRSKQ